MKTDGHSTTFGDGGGIARPGQISIGSVSVDTAARRVYSSDGEVRLSPLEYRLLEVLLERSGENLSRRDLLKYVWDTEADIETRTVDMHVARLRSKLGESSYMIETVRGVGYRLREDNGGDASTTRLSPRAARPASTYRAPDHLDRRTG